MLLNPLKMARSIAEIKKVMTDEFLANEELRSAYGINGEVTWEQKFSTVSVENILLYIVAACLYIHETLWDMYRQEVNRKIEENIVPTIRWYYTQCRCYQHGDVLQYDESSQSVRYQTDDASKRIVTYAAVRDRGGSLLIQVAKGNTPTPLSADELNGFRAYMNQVKIAGVVLEIQSKQPDSIYIGARVQVDPSVITLDGKRISDGSFPVRDAVNTYLQNIVYGGTFNKTKCVDAIQSVEGVIDVTLEEVRARTAEGIVTTVTGNNYTAGGGSFVSQELNTSIIYVLSI